MRRITLGYAYFSQSKIFCILIFKMVRLSTPLLRRAYRQGYFPMPDPKSHELLWFRPDPRAIIPLTGFKVSRSLKRVLKKKAFHVTHDKAFMEVMKGCASRKETWIITEFFETYSQLHHEGFAHSVEVWESSRLVGGLYGVALGGAFFAESKFHRRSNASKIALYHLVEHLRVCGFSLLEVQFLTPHLESLGAIEVADLEYQQMLKHALSMQVNF